MLVSPRRHPDGDRVALGVVPVFPRYLTAFPINILKQPWTWAGSSRISKVVHALPLKWYMYHIHKQRFKYWLLYHLNAKWYIFHPHRITTKRMAALELIVTDCTDSKVVHVPPVQNYAYRTNFNCIYNNCNPGCSIILMQSGTYTIPSELSLALLLITN